MCISSVKSLLKYKCDLLGLLKTLYIAEKLTMEFVVPLMENVELLSHKNVRPMLQVL